MSRAWAFYNEIDAEKAQWIRELIKTGIVADGEVDERDIKQIEPEDLKRFTQCHFFAGIAGWSYALRLAGWPDSRPCWTGSCPCQPFSLIGKGDGFSDYRHLWPDWYRLIRKCSPAVVFGEQVASATIWIDTVLSNLEHAHYACAAVSIPACAVGLPHERQRLWFVADADEKGWQDPARIAATEKESGIGSSASLVHSFPASLFRWSSQPDKDWIVNGIPGADSALGAFGDAIVPQVAAEFIKAYLETKE